MPVLTFTDQSDSYLSSGSTSTDDRLVLQFLGGNDRLRTIAGGTSAYMGDGDDYARIESASSAVVYGEAGSDRFDIFSRFSLVDGGSGNDIFNITTAGFYLRAIGGDGDDRFNFFANMPYRMEATRPNLIFGDDGNDTFYGNGHDVGRVWGGAGDDRFYGLSWTVSDGAGAFGGPGDDLFRVAPANPGFFSERPDEGIDTVQVAFGASYVLPDNVENLQVLGFANLGSDGTLTGNAIANRMTGGDTGESLIGLDGDDRLYGKGADDTLDGGSGSDWLEGGMGRDELTGGAGLDRFIFRNGDFGGSSIATADVIHDFQHSDGDKIRLDPVDANELLAGDQAFLFIGTAAFANVAGQLRYEQISGVTVIEGDLDGDGAADFAIKVDGLVNLVSSDFIL